jgi:molecular chaperone GrpE
MKGASKKPSHHTDENAHTDTHDMTAEQSADLEQSSECCDNDATVSPADGDVRMLREKADKYDALNEKLVRLLAEYDNYRKRVVKERELLYRTATEDLIREMLPILDNLDRATEHRKSETSLEEYVSGIALIEEQLRNVLSHAGLEPLKVVGQPFDPELHDAILQMEVPGTEPGVVAQEAQKGYTLNGRVLRHSKVIVSK